MKETGIMKRIAIFFMITMMSIGICACGTDDLTDQVANLSQMENEYIRSVKGGSPNSYPGKTYGESFDAFFGSPTWKYFKGTKDGTDEDGDGEPDYTEDEVDIVEFTGYCMYQDVKVKALIQFTLSKDDDTFSATYLSFNDVPQNMFVLSALLEKVFTEETVLEESSSNEDDSSQGAVDFDYASLEYAGSYKGWGGYNISFSAYTSVESDEIGVAEISYNGDSIGTYSVCICYDKGDWSEWEYDQFYVMHLDGYDEYLGFYTQDGVKMLDYNGPTKNYDALEMVEHYVS